MQTRRSFLGAVAAFAACQTAAAQGDEAPKLQRAITAATAAGKIFRLPPGVTLATTLRLPPGAHLAGERSSRLVLVGAGPLLVADRADTITLDSLTLDGGGSGSIKALAQFTDIRNLRVSDCTLERSSGAGLWLEQSGGRISGCRARELRTTGIFANDSTGLSIEGNVVEACGDNGIQVFRSSKGDDGTVIQGNRVSNIRADSGGSGQYGNGISVFRAGGVIIEGNVLRRCAYTAVRNNGGSNVSIINNNCAQLGETALYSEFAFDGTVFANNVVDGAMTGISVANFAEHNGHLASVTGNVLRNLLRKPHPSTRQVEGGIGISCEADVAVSGNTIERAQYAGLSLGWGPYLRDVAATGNVIRDAPTGIMVSVAPGAGAALVSGNMISGASKGAVVGMAWDKVMTGDLTREAPPRQVVVSGNLVR